MSQRRAASDQGRNVFDSEAQNRHVAGCPASDSGRILSRQRDDADRFTPFIKRFGDNLFISFEGHPCLSRSNHVDVFGYLTGSQQDFAIAKTLHLRLFGKP